MKKKVFSRRKDIPKSINKLESGMYVSYIHSRDRDGCYIVELRTLEEIKDFDSKLFKKIKKIEKQREGFLNTLKNQV